MARVPAQGAILEYATTLSGPWTQFAFVTSMPTPSATSPEIDGTALDDTTSRVIFLGLTDFGRVSFNFWADHMDANQYEAVLALLKSKASRYWRISWPISVSGNTTKATDTWQGRVQELTKTAEVDGMIGGTMTIRATGDVDYTAEAA